MKLQTIDASVQVDAAFSTGLSSEWKLHAVRVRANPARLRGTGSQGCAVGLGPGKLLAAPGGNAVHSPSRFVSASTFPPPLFFLPLLICYLPHSHLNDVLSRHKLPTASQGHLRIQSKWEATTSTSRNHGIPS